MSTIFAPSVSLAQSDTSLKIKWREMIRTKERKKLKTHFHIANWTKWKLNEKYFFDDLLFSILNDADDQPYVGTCVFCFHSIWFDIDKWNWMLSSFCIHFIQKGKKKNKILSNVKFDFRFFFCRSTSYYLFRRAALHSITVYVISARSVM